MSLLNDLCTNSFHFDSVSLFSNASVSFTQQSQVKDNSLTSSQYLESANDTVTSSINNYGIISKVYDMLNRKHRKLFYQIFVRLEQISKNSEKSFKLQTTKHNLQKQLQFNTQKIQLFCSSLSSIILKLTYSKDFQIKKYFSRIKKYSYKIKAFIFINKMLTKVMKKYKMFAFQELIHFDNFLSRIQISEATFHNILKNKKKLLLIYAYNIIKSKQQKMTVIKINKDIKPSKPLPNAIKMIAANPPTQNKNNWIFLPSAQHIPLKLQARHTERLDPEVNDITDTALLFMTNKENSRVVRFDKRRSLLNWNAQDLPLDEQFQNISAFKMPELDQTAKTSSEHSIVNLDGYFLNCMNCSSRVDSQRLPQFGEQRNSTISNIVQEDHSRVTLQRSFKKDKYIVEQQPKFKTIQKDKRIQRQKSMIQSKYGREKKSLTIIQLEKDKQLIQNLIKELKCDQNKLPLRIQCKNQTSQSKIRNAIQKIDSINERKLDQRKFSQYLLRQNQQHITINQQFDQIESLFTTIDVQNRSQQKSQNVFNSISLNGSAKKETKKLISLKARKLDSSTSRTCAIQTKPTKAVSKLTNSHWMNTEVKGLLDRTVKDDKIKNKMYKPALNLSGKRKDYPDLTLNQNFAITKKQHEFVKIRQRITGSNKKKAKINMFQVYQKM